GGTMFGYWATGRPATATSPKMTVRMAITIATIGRSTKNRTTSYGSPATGETGVARTVIPGRNRARSDTITLSPTFSPFSTIERLPTCGPVCTTRISTLLSAPTTPTWYVT